MLKAAWIVLVVAGVVSAMAGFIFLGGAPATAISIGAVATWIAFGTITSHFVGIRRRVIIHLGRDWAK